GEVYILDWGIAKKLENKTLEEKSSDVLEIAEPPKTQGGITNKLEDKTVEEEPSNALEIAGPYKTQGGIGSAGYMSPEQQKSASEVNETSDIYSLGKILREYYLGLSPWEEIQNLMLSQKDNESQALQNEQKIPKEILAIAKKAIHLKPQERYPRAQDFSADIENYLKGIPISVQDYRLDELFLKWAKRHKQKILLFSVVFFLFLLSISGVFAIQRQSNAKRFQKIYQESIQFQEKAEWVPETEHQSKALKIKYLLDALNSLNLLTVFPQFSKETQQAKLKVGEKLIYLACDTEDYSLASYITNDIQELSEVSEDKKQALLKHIEFTQNKTLKAHLDRLYYWIETLKKTGADAEMEENALFEIVRMNEEGVANRLEEEIRNGVDYFISNSKRSSRLDSYYEFMANVLGHLGNPKVQKTLEKALFSMAQKVVPLEKKPFAESRFMIALVKSLQHLQAKNVAQDIEILRIQMGGASFFYQETALAIALLSKNDSLEKMETLFPSDYAQRAMTKFNQKDYPSAIEDLNQALLLSPNNHEILMQRGLFHLRNQNLEASLADYNEVIRLNPLQSEPYSNRAKLKITLEDFDGAIQDSIQAIQCDPQNIFAYNSLGIAYDRKGEFDKAIESYQLAISVDSTHPNTYFNRAISRENKGDIKGAKEDCEFVLRVEPKFATAYSFRGRLFSLEGNYLQATQSLNEAIRIDPGNSDFYNQRAQSKCHLGDYSGAFEDTQEGIARIKADLEKLEKSNFAQTHSKNPLQKLKKQLSEFYVSRGDIHMAMNNLQGSLQEYEQALQWSNNVDVYTNRSCVYYFLQQYEKAILDATNAIELAPQEHTSYTNRGFSKYQLGDLAGAKIDMKKYLDLTRNFKEQIVLDERKEILKLFPNLDQE
ncbi:MAG: tetratricopeptide repeat protein, partial [Planctomycetota bacterium]